jgi:hypothetical protein
MHYLEGEMVDDILRYHGGVLEFSGGGNPLNGTFDYVLGDYNACDSRRRSFTVMLKN